MRSLFFYTIGVAFACGIFFRSFFNIGYVEVLAVLIVGLALVSAWRIRRKPTGLPAYSPLVILGIFCIAFAGGVSRLHVSEGSVSMLSAYAGEKVSFEGMIAREPEVRETSVHYYVDPKDIGGDGDELILVTTDLYSNFTDDISYGDTVHVEGLLKAPEGFETDTGRTFDYPGYLRAKQVSYVIRFGTMSVVAQEQGTFLGDLFRAKKALMRSIEEAIPEPEAGLGEGVLLGVKRAIGKDLEEIFRETGIIHIVVLSGYNIMIVIEGVMFVLSFLFFPRVRMVVGIGIIVLFALFVGLSATVVRASLMAALLLIARGTGRTYAVLRALVLAGVLMLLHNPYLLVHNPGFQLSFLATLGLILLSPCVESKLTLLPKFIGIRGFVTATLATQIIVLPLLLYEMGTFSIVAVLVNVLVLPMVPVAMGLTLATGLAGMVSAPLGLAVGYVAYVSLGYIITIAELFGKLSFASFRVESFPFSVVFCVYVCMAIFIASILRKKGWVNTLPSISQAEVINEYAGWEIVEEKHERGKGNIPETRSVSGSEKDPFPFR